MGQKRIFFAADDKLVAALRDPLITSGLVVETFERQADLIATVQHDPPDVLLLGARLADGTALSVFKALEPDPPPTMVILTGSQLSTRSGLLRAGISDIMVSPIRPRILASRLAELAGGLRRVEARERASIPVAIDLDGRLVRGTTFDISKEGLGLRLDSGLGESDVVGISLNPPAGAALKLFGRVAYRRVEGNQHVVGVRLLGVSSDEEETLLRFAQVYASTPPVVPQQRPVALNHARVIAKAVGPKPRPPPGRSRWPEDVLSLLDALDLVRGVLISIQPVVSPSGSFPDAELAAWISNHTEIEVEALRFALALTPLERRAFEPEPEIEILLDELDAVRRVPSLQPRPSLDPTLATALCLGAALRFRVARVEQAGRALVGRGNGRKAARVRGEITIDDRATDDLLSSLGVWSLDVQQLIREAELARDQDLATTLRQLQDVAVKQASALAELRMAVRAETLGSAPLTGATSTEVLPRVNATR